MEALTHILLTLTLAAQGPENTNLVERMVKAMSYSKRSGVTIVGIQGTALLPTPND
jgi:hypothetical protein